MSGTLEGGRKAAITNKERYGDEFYRNIGRRGGQNGHTGGFASDPERARWAGAKGGRISRRGDSRMYESKIEANSSLISELVSMGVPIKRIAQDLGVSYSTLRLYLKKGAE